MRDAYPKFEAEGIRLYAISYDDVEMLSEFASKQNIPYPLLSDIDSNVISEFGILNTEIRKGDLFLYGIPFPGCYVTDEEGVVVAKFFHDSYKKRDSPETLIDAALGRVQLPDDTPRATGGDDEVRITVAIQGGKGTIRQGIVRNLVVRFELGEGLHVYGEPVPKGMVPVSISVKPEPGLEVREPITPETRALRLESAGIELQVWSGSVDFVVPFCPTGELASEVRPLDMPSLPLEVSVRYQACDDHNCLLPRTEVFSLDVPLDVIDVPAIPLHMGHGQRHGNYDGMPHVWRLLARKTRASPLGLLRFAVRAIGLEFAALRRRMKS